MITEIFFSLFLVWFIRHAINTYIKRKSLPPGPLPYPFVGNIPQIISAGPIDPFSKLADKYGDVFTVTLPSGNAVILNTASLARKARLAGNMEDLAGRLPETIYPSNLLHGDGLFNCDYSPVYRFRKMVFVSAMHVFGAGVERATVRVEYAVDLAIKNIDTEPGKPFLPKELFECAILVMLWEWLTSKKVELDDPVVKNIREFGEICNRQLLISTFYQLFPLLVHIPTPLSREIKRAQHIRNTIFPPEYRAHQESYVPGVVRDLTDSFIDAYNREIAKESAKDIGSQDDIPWMMLEVVFAGSETTSTALSWFFLYIVLHPNVQSKIHEELDKVVGRARLPIWKDAQNLPFLQATLCEVQRASGFAAFVCTNAVHDMTIAGYSIPKGTLVGLNLAKIHHDEREWSEPEIFKPERFLDCDGKFVGWNKLNGFLPFSFGRRECPGQSLAKIMMVSFASVLLHRYQIELPDGADMPSTEVSTPQLIVKPDDFLVVAKPRKF